MNYCLLLFMYKKDRKKSFGKHKKEKEKRKKESIAKEIKWPQLTFGLFFNSLSTKLLSLNLSSDVRAKSPHRLTGATVCKWGE